LHERRAAPVGSSLLGVLGVLMAAEDGVEVNVLGLTAGIRSLKLPLAGRVGLHGGF
jgi:hypothetical protein